MSEQDSLLSLRLGKHASTTDFATTPGTLVDVLPEKWGFRSPARIPLARAPAHPSNKRFAPIAGPVDMSKAQELEVILRGLSGNNGGAIVAADTSVVVAMILDVVFGAGTDPSGAVTTATGGTPASAILGVTEQARFPVGSVVMFQAPAGTYHVRQVRARAGSSGAGNLTLDRTWTGTVEASANVVRFARWKEDPSVHEHIHLFARAEWANDRRDWKGGMSRATFDFTVGQYARLLTSWLFTDCADAAEADPSVSEATVGGALVNVNNTFWIGNTALYATDAKIDIGGAVTPRRANSGPQGIQGYLVAKGGTSPRPKIMCRLQRGTNTGEVADSAGTPSFNALQAIDKALGEGFGTLDIAFQVGGAAGSVGYFVMQNASCVKAEEVIVDGYKHIDCEFEAESPSDSTFGPLEVHLG